ncbi:hypothetical protein EDD86DRAFT_207742 [Gorgonomyces haynaldii]|nr:hypothetical protein EDD86DRAFT_207742 [Gorgonomyces haynaldii]
MLENLPVELWPMVTQYLSITDYLHIRATCKHLYQSDLVYAAKHFQDNQAQFLKCVQYNKPEYIRRLMQSEQVNVSGLAHFQGFRPLVFRGERNVGIMEMLLEERRIEKRGYRPLAYASWHGYKQIVELLLLDSDVDPSEDDNEAMRFALANNQVDVCEILYDTTRVDPALDRNLFFCLACKEGRFELVQRLLKDKRVCPHDQNNMALYHASLLPDKQALNMCRLLLSDARVDPSSRNNAAFFNASQRGNVALIRYLLTECDIDPFQNDALMDKCLSNHALMRVILQDPRSKHMDHWWVRFWPTRTLVGFCPWIANFL